MRKWVHSCIVGSNVLDSLALISDLAVLVEGKFASQNEGVGYCAPVTASSGISCRLPSLLRPEAAPNPCTTLSCRNSTVLGLCSSLWWVWEAQTTLQGSQNMFEFVSSVTKGWHVPSQSHCTLASKENMGKKTHKTPTKTPHQLGNQQCLKNWSDTCGCKHIDNDLSSCVFLYSLSPPGFPLGCFYILTPAQISTLGFHSAPGVGATHPFPSCSCSFIWKCL